MKRIVEAIIGQKARGEVLPQPTLISRPAPENRPSEIEWCKEFKVGSRYGHRGSFYQNKSVYLYKN